MSFLWPDLPPERPAVMGILNVTPDSFSDGGRHSDPAAAIAAGRAMAAAGADILDIGGESTRPGARPVPPEEECRRVVPVIAALAAAGHRVSVDTRNAATMAAALEAGAVIVNDVSALAHDPRALPLVAARGCAVVLMHMRGTPATMASLAHYDDVVAEVREELAARLAVCRAAGLRMEAIALDPGIGFAKTRSQNAALLRGLPALAALGYPLLVGLSRKSLIGALAGTGGEEPPPGARLPGSLAGALFALSRGARILRVHDVAETVQAVRVWGALAGPEVPGG
ncbi:MAG: dihydropteroate synthase [Acetobacteraceae bacterium]